MAETDTNTTPATTAACSPIQASLNWCEGTPQYAGIRRRLYYTAVSNLVAMPRIPTDAHGHPTSAILVGEFEMKEGAKFYGIDHLPDKAQATSEAQGEYPSQSSHDKVVMIHPGIGAEASAAAAYIHNTNNVYVMEDFDGRARVIGIEEQWRSKGTVNMDFGQGAAGTASTTITIEGDNRLPFPEYRGKLVTEDGEIDYSKK